MSIRVSRTILIPRLHAKHMTFDVPISTKITFLGELRDERRNRDSCNYVQLIQHDENAMQVDGTDTVENKENSRKEEGIGIRFT